MSDSYQEAGSATGVGETPLRTVIFLGEIGILPLL